MENNGKPNFLKAERDALLVGVRCWCWWLTAFNQQRGIVIVLMLYNEIQIIYMINIRYLAEAYFQDVWSASNVSEKLA